MTTNFVSNQEFRDATPGLDLSKYTETTLSGVITRATARAERYLEYSLAQATVVNEKKEGYVDSDLNLVVFTDKRPISSVSAISIVKSTTEFALSLTDGAGNTIYDIDNNAYSITYPGLYILLEPIFSIRFADLRHYKFYTKVSCVAGYDMATGRPEDLKDAIILYAQDIVARQVNPSGASMIRQGGVTIKYETGSRRNGSSGDSDLVADAKAILTTYKKTSGW